MQLLKDDVDNVGNDHDLFESIDPRDTIKKVVRKENRELIALGRCEPTKENKERCRFQMEDIQRYGVSAIFKRGYLSHIFIYEFWFANFI